MYILYITTLNVTDLYTMWSKLIHHVGNENKHLATLIRELEFVGWPSTLVEAESIDVFKVELAKQKIPLLSNN